LVAERLHEIREHLALACLHENLDRHPWHKLYRAKRPRQELTVRSTNRLRRAPSLPACLISTVMAVSK
jgi:hypothetical protein